MDDSHESDVKWEDSEEITGPSIHNKKSNVLPLWGNERTMNLNPLVLTNIQSSHYFKVNLYELKTYHEVIDEIYYKVTHMEPWEKGSRKTAGQTGMCGGVRGVGAGGIVSTAFCLLYKLFTLKLTRKQVNGLITHTDSPYIRGLGFMYVRYTQPPADLWDWYEPYLDDSEELDVKAGGGQVMTIGNILHSFLCKLEWFSTLFPRIPVPIQQKIERKMKEKYPAVATNAAAPHSTSSRRNYRNESDDMRQRDRMKHLSTIDYRDRRRHETHRSPTRDRFRDRSPHADRLPDRSPHSSGGKEYRSSRDDYARRSSSDRYHSHNRRREIGREDHRDYRSRNYSRESSIESGKNSSGQRSEASHDEKKRRKYEIHGKRSFTPDNER